MSEVVYMYSYAMKEVSAFHTSIVVEGTEYTYGNYGIKNGPRATSEYEADRIDELGVTQKTRDEIIKFILSELNHIFTSQRYNLLTNNCHCFAERLSIFLCGQKLPAWVSAPENMIKASIGPYVKLDKEPKKKKATKKKRDSSCQTQ